MKKTESLPRHTILANTPTRFGAALTDVAIFFFGFLLLFLTASSPIFATTVLRSKYDSLNKYEIDSHLVYLNPETNTTEVYQSEDDYTVYETPIRYFYLSYLTGENITKEDEKAPNYNIEMENEDGVKYLPKDYYTVEWYNYNILGITRDDPDAEMSSCYFTYQKTDGVYDKSKIGIPRTQRYNKDRNMVVDLTNNDLAVYMKPIYQKAFTHLTAQSFYYPLASEVSFFSALMAVIPLFLSGVIFYVIIPLFLKDQATLGKKLFKLGLANNKGYKAKKTQLLMRFIPMFLVLAFLVGLYFLDILTSTLVILVIILTSFGLAMASPKHMALHDYVAQTIVIDAKGSILFNDQSEELIYLEKEDNKEKERVSSKENEDGEEPEISYEK